MLLEAFEYLATPCPRTLRDLGYLNELVAIGARHRRCRAAWQDHLARTRQAIIAAIARAPRRRTAVLMGSGRLLDVPLAELAASFETVILIDIVHPLPARWRARTYPNVELRAADITGTTAALHALRPDGPLPAPRSFTPLFGPDIDLVVSLNVWSQLGVLPGEWIERRRGSGAEAEAEAFAASLGRQHVQDLSRCTATVCLIADVEWMEVAPDGAVIERHSSIHGLPVPRADAEWIWRMAPAPELDPKISQHRRVIVAYDPGKAGTG